MPIIIVLCGIFKLIWLWSSHFTLQDAGNVFLFTLDKIAWYILWSHRPGKIIVNISYYLIELFPLQHYKYMYLCNINKKERNLQI